MEAQRRNKKELRDKSENFINEECENDLTWMNFNLLNKKSIETYEHKQFIKTEKEHLKKSFLSFIPVKFHKREVS